MDQRSGLARFVLAEIADDVLDHDDQRVDQHADRDRKSAEAHEVGRHPDHAHDDQCNDDGQRQAESDHQRGPPVAEEKQQEDDDEGGGLAERSHHGADRAVDQAAAVIEHVDGDALRQRRLQLGEPGAHVADELTGVGAAQAEDEPLDRLAAAVRRDCAIAGQRPDFDARDVVDQDRHALAGVDHDGLDVFHRADAPLDPDQGAVLALVHPSGTVVPAVGFDGPAKHVVGNAARGKRIVARHDLEGADVTAERIDVRNAGDRPQRGADHPIQQSPALGERKLGTVDREHEHFAQRACDRRQPSADPVGEITRDVR